MKNAKKSMFITTILMVAVLIVAVSTATFAWYTASGSGTATQANLVSANSSAANVAVGWANDSTTTGVVFSSTAVEVAPMAPTAAPTLDMSYADLVLESGTLDSAKKFNGSVGAAAGKPATPWTVSDGAAENAKTSFYVINHNVNEGVTVNMTIKMAANVLDNEATTDVDESVTYTNNDKLVVAVFIDGKLKGVFLGSDLAGYAAGPIVGGAAAADMPTVDVGKTSSIAITLPAKAGSNVNYAQVQIKAWLDGAALTQEFAAQPAAFSFNFEAATAQP